MQGMLVAALRDFDPPGGGAERSLAALLNGVSIPSDVRLQRALDVDTASPDMRGWDVCVMQSGDRGESIEEIGRYKLPNYRTTIGIEDLISGMAWRLRNRKNGRPLKLLESIHLKRKNKQFSHWVSERIASYKKASEEAGTPLIGVTQLHWAAGAALAFKNANIPYIVFVRDELCFQHPKLYGPCLEEAAAVVASGEGFGDQISSVFNVKRMANVHLPVDFSRLGSEEEVMDLLNSASINRKNDNSLEPRIALIGVTPEKGFKFYDKQLLPALAHQWPDARVHIYGGGGYAKILGKHSNTSLHGFVPPKELFPQCDIHLIRYETTGSWGRVINEAGHFYKPTVCNAIGSEPEAVGPGGIVLPCDASTDEWVNALKRVYEKLDEYGSAAHSHRLIIDHHSSIDEFRSVLEEVQTS